MTWTQSDVWAAAAMAYRINGNRYVKQSYSISSLSDPDLSQSVTANKNIVINHLTGDSAIGELTAADRELGEKARATISAELTYRILRDAPMSSFDQNIINALNIASWEQTDSRNWAIIASQIRTHFKLIESKKVARSLSDGHIGQVKDRVDLKIEVIKSTVSHYWNTNYVTAKTESNQLVMFSYKELLSEGTKHSIKGTVKSLGKHREFGVDLTQLNRVKVLDK